MKKMLMKLSLPGFLAGLFLIYFFLSAGTMSAQGKWKSEQDAENVLKQRIEMLTPSLDQGQPGQQQYDEAYLRIVYYKGIVSLLYSGKKTEDATEIAVGYALSTAGDPTKTVVVTQDKDPKSEVIYNEAKAFLTD